MSLPVAAPGRYGAESTQESRARYDELLLEQCWATKANRLGDEVRCWSPVVSDVGLCAEHLEEYRRGV